MQVTPQDRRDYPFILGYCHFIGSYDYWTAEQVQMAREVGAPRTAIQVWIEPAHNVPTCRTLDSLSPEFRARLIKHMEGIGLIDHEIRLAVAA
ncbi:hypothetical protein SAMN05216275_10555 [Streptosporangium canum]|uniref:Uncharacterized protein n=1 Tax=Streptosporangium canum TaxID=324952 RepID=A0A1I3L8Y5_9ACTN|nr:hypothetical protein [Streptosporangium canum]SFI81214.1 hypothetical protein SAMN05216275_10555 [Streptosporangium canum]